MPAAALNVCSRFLFAAISEKASLRLAFRDLFLHMEGRPYALKVTDGVIAENPVGKFYRRQFDIHRSFYLHR
jgi:hypothetical protein